MSSPRARALAIIVLSISAGLFAGCAQVPRESVELSSTVGRDLTFAHQSHRELAKVLFGRLRADIDRFVDNVYAPYQIRAALAHDAAMSKSAKPEERRASLLLGIDKAYAPGALDADLTNVVKGMGYFVKAIREDVETMRRDMRAPIDQQEADVIGAIDRNYAQLVYANSIVTGYLGSVVKVHDAQADALNAIGLDGKLPEQIGKKLAAASERVDRLVQKAEKADATAASIQQNIADLKSSASINGQ